jgi:hypothetical protein
MAHPKVNGRCLTGAAAALAAAVLLSGCGSTLATMPLIGEPAKTPPAPAVRPDYPNIGVKPSDRPDKPMTAAERQKVEAELNAARTQGADEKRKQINQPLAQ